MPNLTTTAITTDFTFSAAEYLVQAPVAPNEFVWTSEDGRQTTISKLEDSHLANIMKMLSRNMVGIPKDSGQYTEHERILKLMRAERDKRSERP